jgi:hypothetical protein
LPVSSALPTQSSAAAAALRDLDSSDLVSLDLTVRRSPAAVESGGGRLKVSRPCNLSQVVEEATCDISAAATTAMASATMASSGVLDSSTPFSPLSDRCPVRF